MLEPNPVPGLITLLVEAEPKPDPNVGDPLVAKAFTGWLAGWSGGSGSGAGEPNMLLPVFGFGLGSEDDSPRERLPNVESSIEASLIISGGCAGAEVLDGVGDEKLVCPNGALLPANASKPPEDVDWLNADGCAAAKDGWPKLGWPKPVADPNEDCPNIGLDWLPKDD